ncbi:deoxyribodipyrimidine photo-lyase [Dechloromonas sp. H13]|uniref:cryptochrome/photolyase family protein n=1 Tax=Dechloromonas sp. H13 TaxID=2570193 RepID=UPI00129252C9|nr:deoxyribodipyrimidine photo-lyase [Dechloromonas sp. H13]
MNHEKALVWFRRDLRDADHAALAAALATAGEVYCAFVFDREILDALPTKHDRRVHFIHASLGELDAALRARGGGLIVRHGRAAEEIPALARALGVNAVFANRDYEPAAKRRDAEVAARLGAINIGFRDFKDQAIFDRDEVLTQAGKAFTVFTPYKNAWLKRLTAADCATCAGAGRLAGGDQAGVPALAEIGFETTDLAALGIRPGMSGARALWDEFRQERLGRYGALRDYPAIKGVSYLSVHLRFGTIGIRELVRCALENRADAWLNELIWRDFYFMILDRFPHVVGHAFKPEYDAIRWNDWPEGFAAWCAGRTGYPLVDAAMRQLDYSGWMHNRLRMVVASFLTKDLGIDWRLGERYFADRLNDFDLAANNGGWQWAASSGCDAQPYFRIFNPVTQSEKFDPEGRFIRRYVPELAALPNKRIHAPWQMGKLEQESIGVVIGRDYPGPIVDHATAREKTLGRYAVVKKPPLQASALALT